MERRRQHEERLARQREEERIARETAALSESFDAKQREIIKKHALPEGLTSIIETNSVCEQSAACRSNSNDSRKLKASIVSHSS